jgi:hypothetical protein
MQKTILVSLPLVAILATAGIASAEPWEGAWALEFQVRPTFLGYHDPGIGIAAKHHFTERTAVRAGFTVSTSSFDYDDSGLESRITPYDSLSFLLSSTEAVENRNISMFAHVARNLGVGNRIAAFVEAGPVVRRTVTGDSEVETQTLTITRTRISYVNSRSWDYGAEAQGGFEWFVRSRLSVAGRYGVWGMWTRAEFHQEYVVSDTNNLEIQARDSTRHGFTIGTSAATFSVIAYW